MGYRGCQVVKQWLYLVNNPVSYSTMTIAIAKYNSAIVIPTSKPTTSHQTNPYQGQSNIDTKAESLSPTPMTPLHHSAMAETSFKT
jgi:hypothetical protein